jgi:hypothetical protein
MPTYTSYTTRKPDTNAITIAPNIADINLADTYEQLVDTKNTSLNSTLTPDIMPAGELQAAMDYRNAFKQGDTITAVNNFYSKLTQTYFNQQDFTLDTILFWYYKLNYSNKEITAYKSQASFYNQNILPNQIPGASLFAQNAINDTNESSNYFDIVGDSIGSIANSKFIQLDSTLPLFDVSQQYYGTPIPIAASTDSKISANTRNVMYNLSQKTTMFMKRNLLNIGYINLTLQQNLAADSTTSHGLNLINDLPTFVKINKMLDQLKSALGTVYSQAKAFSFIQYLNNVGNTTALNLRDIFPVAKGDREFTVVTSQENAQASIAEAQQEQSDAAAAAALAHQQQAFSISNSPAINGTLQPVQPVSSGNAAIAGTANTPGAGNSTVVNGKIQTDGSGYGQPDPTALGQGVAYDPAEARNDGDGSSGNVFGDKYYQSDTSGHQDGGRAANALVDQYVVVSPEVRAANKIQIGDWAQVTNPGTGATTYARVMDVGPRNAPPGECSTAALRAVGVGITPNGNTVGNPQVQVTYFPGSKAVAGSANKTNVANIASASTPKPGGV